MSLKISNLKKIYIDPFKRNRTESVKNVSFDISKGEIYALIGQNGAGKTTTIKCILKFIKPTKGEITFDDQDLNVIMEKNKVGYLPELLQIPSIITARQYLMDLGILRGLEGKYVNWRINELAMLLDIDKALDMNINKLSKGMKRKIAFIQAVINDPALLVLDEPTDGLDPISRRKILKYIRTMANNGTTILITSHLLADLEKICDRVGLMNEGQLLSEISIKCSGNGDIINLDLEEWYFQTLMGKENTNEAIN